VFPDERHDQVLDRISFRCANLENPIHSCRPPNLEQKFNSHGQLLVHGLLDGSLDCGLADKIVLGGLEDFGKRPVAVRVWLVVIVLQNGIDGVGLDYVKTAYLP
jgi:hypothetical protein